MPDSAISRGLATEAGDPRGTAEHCSRRPSWRQATSMSFGCPAAHPNSLRGNPKAQLFDHGDPDQQDGRLGGIGGLVPDVDVVHLPGLHSGHHVLSVEFDRADCVVPQHVILPQVEPHPQVGCQGDPGPDARW